MTKRIAVIGCSFTDYYQDRRNPEDPVKTWSEWMLDDNPDIQIDNYACSAHSLKYVEFVLQYIIKYRSDYYHAVMFNIPPLARTWAPVCQKNNIQLVEEDSWFDVEQISEKYNVYIPEISSLTIMRVSNAHGFARRPVKLLNEIDKNYSGERSNVTIPNILVLDIIQDYYSQKIPNLIYWSHEQSVGDRNLEETVLKDSYPNLKGNLSDTDKCVLDFLIDKYGEYRVARDFLTDSAHLSSLGNKVMYEEFLLPNKNVQQILKH